MQILSRTNKNPVMLDDFDQLVRKAACPVVLQDKLLLIGGAILLYQNAVVLYKHNKAIAGVNPDGTSYNKTLVYDSTCECQYLIHGFPNFPDGKPEEVSCSVDKMTPRIFVMSRSQNG